MSPPSSLPPAGVPPSSNAKYVIVAVVFLLGIGATVWLRRSAPAEAPPPPKPVASAPSASAPVNPKLDDIPPPPPEESAEAKPTGPKIVYVNARAGCDGTCRGKPSSELSDALTIRGNQARRCYNQALAQDSTLKGHVSIAVRVGPSGNLCSANVATNDMGTPAVANCAANIFRAAASYPAPRGGCVDATIPLSFVAPGQH
jgi:hypothetical protein